MVNKGFSNVPNLHEIRLAQILWYFRGFYRLGRTPTRIGEDRQRSDAMRNACIILILSVFSVWRSATLRFCFRSDADPLSVCSWDAVNPEGVYIRVLDRAYFTGDI